MVLPCPSRLENRPGGFPQPVCQELSACGFPRLVRHVDLSLDLMKLIRFLQSYLTDPVVSNVEDELLPEDDDKPVTTRSTKLSV